MPLKLSCGGYAGVGTRLGTNPVEPGGDASAAPGPRPGAVLLKKEIRSFHAFVSVKPCSLSTMRSSRSRPRCQVDRTDSENQFAILSCTRPDVASIPASASASFLTSSFAIVGLPDRLPTPPAPLMD